MNAEQFTRSPEYDSGSGPRFPEPLIIGRTPALKSAPGPLPTARYTGPDTVLDGADLPGLTIRAASIRGDYHRYDGLPRQDALGIRPLSESRVLVCVADGLGSRELSHLGAEAACRTAFEVFPPDFSEGSDFREDAKAYFSDISEGVIRCAERTGVAPEQLATTLTVAVIDISPDQPARRCRVMRVGDSTAMQLHKGFWSPCFLQDNEQTVTSSATRALPMDAQRVNVAATTLYPGDMLLLCTDGLAKPMVGRAVSDQLATWWSAAAPPSLPEFHWQLSFRAKTHDDDRTAVCVWGA
ncbi:hypothetical protein GCM10014719_67700 [Planomonospora parontospora subsp. antibiotica]|nr:hypothetical protein GCM10014719_67700 [Planomonospora parontospora subsp. antibiotica]GII19978.1 hypothetical protein Ppa05_67040 [Planomonospora parontospora subsp. antibiotica]